MNNGIGGRHPVFPERRVKANPPLLKIPNPVGRAHIPRLTAALVNEQTCRKVSSLTVIDQHTAAPQRVKMRIQKQNRHRKLKKHFTNMNTGFRPQKNNSGTICDPQILNPLLYIIPLLINLDKL